MLTRGAGRPLLPALLLALATSRLPAQDVRIRSDDVNLTGALQRVARTFFPVGRGKLLSVVKTHDYPLFSEGVEFEKYRVRGPDGGERGSFVRMRCYPEGNSAIDLAIRVENGTIAGVVPLRPVVVEGVPLLGFPQALDQFREIPIGAYARPLSRLFAGLNYLRQSSVGTSRGPLSREESEPIRQLLEKLEPPLKVGDPLPAFTATDQAGQPVSPVSLRGQWSLLVVASVQHPMSREVLGWVEAYATPRRERFQLVEVLVDPREALDQFRRVGGKLTGRIVLDGEQLVHDALKVTFMPVVLVTDPAGRCRGTLAAPWKDQRTLSATLDGFMR
jgi:hypothetical protein